MRIRRIEVYNYRSICHLKMCCDSLVVMLGPNNHGKSNVLSAIEFALSPSVKPSQTDLCTFCGEDHTLWVELTFYQLTEQERRTFANYLHDDEICIRKTAKYIDDNTINVTYNGWVEEPKEWWLRNDSVSKLADQTQLNSTPLSDVVGQSKRLTQTIIKEAQATYIQQHRDKIEFERHLESNLLLNQRSISSGILPDFFLIPAVRDLSDETKIKTTTVFGKLLTRAVREMAEREPRFQQLKHQLEELVNVFNRPGSGKAQGRLGQLADIERRLKDELEGWGVSVEIEVVAPDIEKLFELGTNLHIDDGVRTLAEQKGHGLQRAIMVALVRAWADILRTYAPSQDSSTTASRASSESVIFAIEEPELFLHPHAQRRFAAAIQEISASSNHQVFLCSHSTHFVDLEHYKSVCIINKPSLTTGTIARQCASGLFDNGTDRARKKRFHMARWVNPDRGEMFFAKKVAFVEGETEKAILPFLAEKKRCLDHEISIIDCGSKHNLPLYIAIANAFKIPYVVIHDEDPLPDLIPEDWNEEKRREKRRTFELNQEIKNAIDAAIGKALVLSPNFEEASGVSRSQGDKKGKALAALDHFEGIEPSQIPSQLEKAVKAIYS